MPFAPGAGGWGLVVLWCRCGGMMPVRRWLRVAVGEGGARVVAVGPKAAASYVAGGATEVALLYT